MLREWWRYSPGDRERALTYANPCQSTGAWYLEPTPMVSWRRPPARPPVCLP